ncbi:hypothetical protein LCGC14_1994570, partial [marine sediment metagenome]
NFIYKRTFKKLMKGRYIVLSGMLLAACNQVPGKDFYADRMDKISSIEVLLKTVTQVAGKEEPIEHQKIGNGFVVGNYVFSRDHVTSKHYLNKLQSPYGVVKVEFQNPVLSEQTFLDDLVLHSVYESNEDDIAIFDLSKNKNLCNKYCNHLSLDDLMTEDELYQGMEVYWMGNPRGINDFYKESRISKLKDEKDEDTIYENTFMIQDPIIPGTSGKPLWHNDKIIGVAHYFWEDMSGWGFMSNYIEIIKEYENDMQEQW